MDAMHVFNEQLHGVAGGQYLLIEPIRGAESSLVQPKKQSEAKVEAVANK
jgi:hypothetical protein